MSDVHHRAIIVDGHCDTPYRLLINKIHVDDPDPQAQVDLRSLREGGITASFFAAYVPPYYAGRGAAAFAYKAIDLIRGEAAGHPELKFCIDSAGIREAKRSGKTAIMIGVEGGHAIEDSLDTLRDFYRLGTRYMTLTHVNTNNWCDSSGDAGRHGGLTDFGRKVVGTMNDIGMIVDVSHISDAAFEQVIETTRAPVIASHSSCRAISRHPRNMTDDMLRTLARNGGVCMINFYSAFVNDDVARVLLEAPKSPRARSEDLPDDRTHWNEFLGWYKTLGCPPAKLEDVADHIIHAVEVAGPDSVGIGSDFDGVPALPEGLESVAALPRLTDRLLQRGVPEPDVEKILGANFLRVFEKVEHVKSTGHADRG